MKSHKQYQASPGLPPKAAASGTNAVKPVVCQLQILAANDIYTFRDVNGIGGYSTLKSLVNQHRKPYSVFVINGDVLGGSQLAETFKGESVISVLNAMQPDIVAVGNHEFDYGVERLEELIKSSRFDWLSGNIRRKSKNYGLLGNVKPYKIYDYFICGRTGEILARREVIIPELNEELSHPFVSEGGRGGSSNVTGPAIDEPNAGGGSVQNGPAVPPPPRVPEELLESLLGAYGSQSSNSVCDGIRSVECLRIGFLGACTVTTPFCSYPGPDVVFEEAPEVMEHVANRLKAYGCQLLIGLTHLTMSEDSKVASTCRGKISVILGGHEHTPIIQQTDETFIFKTGQNGNWLGIVDFSVVFKPMSASLVNETDTSLLTSMQNPEAEAKTTSDVSIPFADVVSVVPSFSLKTNMHQPRDPATEEVIAKYEKKLQEEEAKGPDVTRVLVKLVDGQLDTRTASCRVKHASGASLVADAMYSFMGPDLADFAIINGGFIRGDKVYPSGTNITLKDIKIEFPFPKKAVVIRIRGADLLAALEQQLANYPAPFGAFPHLSTGCKLCFDGEQPSGSRIQNFTIHGKEIDPEKEYRVVLTEFVAGGGDGCVAFLKGKREPLPADKVDCLVSQIIVDYLDSQPHRLYTPVNNEERVVEVGRARG